MAIIHVDESTVGLPNSGRLSGTNGDLVGILDVALPLNGWAIEYTSGNARVYRPGTGNRFRLHVYDDSSASGDARLAVVRGCENASDATTLVDPFPLVSQVADASCNWHKSTAASTTARAFDIWVGETFVIVSINNSGNTNVFTLNFFGDYAPALSGHTYNTCVSVRSSSNTTSADVGNFSSWPNTAYATSPGGTATRLFGARDYTGTLKSPIMAVQSIGNVTAFGALTGLPQAQAGVTVKVDTIKTTLIDYATQTPGGSSDSTRMQATAGWLPNILFPLHAGRGALNTRDDYTNTAVDMAAGKVVTVANNATSGFAVVQESDDWTPPNG
jgi:hypothetical protein